MYVQQPPGFPIQNENGKVLKLKKALYGLKQAPRAWNAKLDHELVALGFSKSKVEHAVHRRGVGESLLVVGVYVDDLIICGPSVSKITEFKQQMMSTFNMSDLGLLSYYLGMEVRQNKDSITICQRSYAAKIVEQCQMTECNPTDTPMKQRVKLTTAKPGTEKDVTRYRSVIGSLRYLVNTRPDLAFAVGLVSRFMEAPTEEHWGAMEKIIRYVKGTLGYGIKFKRSYKVDLSLLDCSGDLVLRKSTAGILFFLGLNPITWSSQKQKVVALSSCEAEYVAGALGTCQGVWLSTLLADITVQDVKKFRLLIDNQATIELSKNPVFHERSKHIDTRYHYIRDCIEQGVVDVDHVRTEDQLADILTKPLGRVRFVELRSRLGVVEVQQD